MKYTIELTNKQKAQMDCIIDIVHRYVGFNPKLEPIKATNVEDTNEYEIGYKIGFGDGKKQAINELPELANKENEIYNDGYNKGYNSAINDYNAMYEWLHDCFIDFEKFLLEKGFYTDEKFLDGFVVGQLMYDLICDHDIAEVISEFKKWQEEKKKAEDESIKVGDEVITSNGYIAIITFICDEYMTAIFNDGSSGEFINETLKKTGRHFGEVEQLLDKLRGVKSEE